MRKYTKHTRLVATRLLVATAFLALALISEAAPITPKQAQQRATTFFRQRLGKNAAPPQLSLALAKPSVPGDLPLDLGRLPKQESPASASYYIYNKVGGGYVIVSGDDGQQPIIGYSDRGHIVADSMPENMRWWLDGFYRTAKQEAADTSYPDPIDPMLTSEWGQNAPYNQQTPLIDGKHASAGCGAVALAQIIRYQQWPCSVGYIPSINKCEELPPTCFDWDKLLDTYDSTSPDDCQDEVAKLMRYVGQAINTKYGSNSSSFNSDDVTYALSEYFGFVGCHKQLRNAFTDQTIWDNEMYESLQFGNPVLYGGEKAGGSGHAFVLDGYSDGYFHINWGWTGSYDGYFLLSNLSPSSTTQYNRNQYAFTNIQNPYNRGEYHPSEIIKTTDMFFNPELSREGCLTRENKEADFTDIVIQEDRLFKVGRVDDTIQYALALVDGGHIETILSDTLLYLSDIQGRKQRLTFRFSIYSHIPCSDFTIQTVSRNNEDDYWRINAIDEEEYYIVTVTEKHLYLNYVTSSSTGTSCSIKTGFDSDEKFATIGQDGTLSDNLKTNISFFGDLQNHYYDYSICLFSENSEFRQTKTILQQKPLSSANNIEYGFNLDMRTLPDGKYFLDAFAFPCGADPNQDKTPTPHSKMLKLIKQDSLVYVQPANLVTPSCNSLDLGVLADIGCDIVKFNRNNTTQTYHVPLRYSVINEQEDGYVDYGIGMFNQQDATLQHVLYSDNCQYISHLPTSTIPLGMNGRLPEQENLLLTVHIPANLPDGNYIICAIGRDANTSHWENISEKGAIVFATIKNDTLSAINEEILNTVNLEVDSLTYLNDNEAMAYLRNPSDLPINGYVTLKFGTFDPFEDGGAAELSYKSSSRIRVSLDKKASVRQIVPMDIKPETGLFVFYDCLFKTINDSTIFDAGILNPLSISVSFNNVSVESVNDTTLLDRFMLYFTFNATPTAQNTKVVGRNVDQAGNTLLEYSQLYSGDSQSGRFDLGFEYSPLQYHHYVNSKIHFELAYTRFFNDTVVVYRSHEYKLAPFAYVEDYSDGEIDYHKQPLQDEWNIPDNVTYVTFKNASRVGDAISVIPNSNPNTVYLFRNDQPLPDNMQECFVVNDDRIYDREFHIVDGYPVTTSITGSNIHYQRHFNPGEWVLLGTPFVRVCDEEALSQFDDIMTFDRFEDNTIYFKKWEKTPKKEVWPTALLVRCLQEKDINFIGGKNKQHDRIADHIGPTWGKFKVLRRLLPCHYDVMYKLATDGSCFRRTQGDVPPFRFVLLPVGNNTPELIRVVIEGYQSPTAITDVSEQHQAKGYYTLDGRPVNPNYQGVVIEVAGNGKTRKIIKQ